MFQSTLFWAESFPRLYIHPFQSPINHNPLWIPSNVKHSEPVLDVPLFICEHVPHFHCQLALAHSCFTSVCVSGFVKIKTAAHSQVFPLLQRSIRIFIEHITEFEDVCTRDHNLQERKDGAK